MLKLKLQYFGHLMQRTDLLEKTQCWERLKAREEGNDRGWDGCMASLTQWTWVWAGSGVGDGQGVLGCYSLWDCKESDMTERVHWTECVYISAALPVHPTLPSQSVSTCLFSTSVSISVLQIISWFWLGSISSVAQSCPTLSDPMNHSTPGIPVHHQVPEFTHTHVHCVSDAIQPSHPLPSPSPPAFNLSQHQGLFKWVSSSHQVAKVLEFQLQHQSFQWTPRTGLL